MYNDDKDKDEEEKDSDLKFAKHFTSILFEPYNHPIILILQMRKQARKCEMTCPQLHSYSKCLRRQLQSGLPHSKSMLFWHGRSRLGLVKGQLSPET